jgi:hypothetical protein
VGVYAEWEILSGATLSYSDAMRRTLSIAIVSALTLICLSGCGGVSRGPVVNEDRSIGIATSIVLDSPGDLTITEGEPSLVISAPTEALERLTADVNNGELVLGVTPGSPDVLNGKISYKLTMPSLDRIEISGSGDVESDVPGDTLTVDISGSGDVNIDSIAASAVTLNISGSGNITFSGRADDLAVSIDGSGDVEAEGLETARVIVDIAGSGEVAIAASDRLDVSISGSGSVTYEGNPEVTQDISGDGDVGRRNE